MRKSSLKVALNISRDSVPLKIAKVRLMIDNINANNGTFQYPNPPLATVQAAADALELAFNAAADGGKTKTAFMHDKEDELLKLVHDLAAYVEGIANGDESIVHLAGMESKKKPQVSIPEFNVSRTGIKGEVSIRVKPKAKILYSWEFTKGPLGENEWQEAHETTTAKTVIAGLDPGVEYWFRVEFKGHLKSYYAYAPISIIVV